MAATPAAANRPGPALRSSVEESAAGAEGIGAGRSTVYREPRRPPPDERKLQNNFRAGAGEAAETAWYRPRGGQQAGSFVAPGTQATAAASSPASNAPNPSAAPRTSCRPSSIRS